jgi:suppressor for copper-sensitivity B
MAGALPWRVAIAALACWLAAAGGAVAQKNGASPWVNLGQGQVRLISAAAAVGGATELGVQVRLAPGWKTYWRAPGEAGIPPTFEWTGSDNLAQAEVRWPAPRRVDVGGIDSLIYQDEVVFPVTATAANSGRPLAVRLKLGLGICKDICIPAEADLALDLLPGEAKATPWAATIAHYAAKVPAPAAARGIAFTASVARGPSGDQVAVTVRGKSALNAPDLIVEGPETHYFSRGQMVAADGGKTLLFRVPVSGPQGAAALAGRQLTLTLLTADGAVEEKLLLAR